MFHTIRESISSRMRYLEAIDAIDRVDGTPRLERLRQIPPETGKFLALLAASVPQGSILEIGTSAGYSTLWLSLACEYLERRLTTFEVLSDKALLAKETFRSAGVEDLVDLVEGDALEHLPKFDRIAFCFLDAEKEIYERCYEEIIPRLVPGGLLVADNAINHQESLQTVLARAAADARVDSLVVPIGKGELVCRKI
ncbi:MAG TPA: O-methyltransferase [candidate division Zixibacteria bacterium]|nr:O-methyltransferase [candidate division Zixibacteria bacterium]